MVNQIDTAADRRRFRNRWLVSMGIGLGVVGLASLPPFLDAGIRSHVMQFFATVCHQLPDRSPHINGVALAVCHRCYGIYWGLPLAALVFLWLRQLGEIPRRWAPWVLAASLIPLTVDWTVDVLGLWHNVPVSRFLTGLVFGSAAGWFFVKGLSAPTQNRSAK